MASGPKQAQCKHCGAAIYWARHEDSGRPMPFDAEPVEGGRWALFMRKGDARCRYSRGEVAGPLRRPHFETCTEYRRDGT